ncbi:MAG: sorting protein [Bryobacterales bacterium]|nr:sorting protein [Bryobacterales bacterium]
MVGALALAPAATAATVFQLTQDGCTGSGGCGTAPFGNISLDQTTPTLVTVTLTLKSGENFAGTGAGDALEFNVVGPVTIGSITSGFGVGPAPDTASTFGTFLHSVTCTSCQGGTGPTGPLSFTVTSATGVTISSFIANTGGFFFASDIFGNNNTGNVAAIGPGSTVPEPITSGLVGVGLISLFLMRRRASR